jgi:phospholipid transport system substrate-binding protein
MATVGWIHRAARPGAAWVLVAALLACGAGSAVAGMLPADTAPDALVQTVSAQVLDDIRGDKALRSGDIDKLQKLIDDKVAPYVDFERMTRLAVGKGWRAATAEQRDALMREFRTLLVRTYSGALSHVTDHQVKLRPFHAQPADTDVMVRTQVAPSAGEPIQLDYRLEKTDAGWKIYDLNILGISLVENFKNSFASEINQGGVDGLIKSLTDRNRQLAAGNSKG